MGAGTEVRERFRGVRRVALTHRVALFGKEAMNEETFQRKLAELIAEIGTLPAGERDKLELLAEQTRERHQKLKETVNSLQESIDFVRLSIKYMLFDLEATRRENDQLRKMLEDNSSQ